MRDNFTEHGGGEAPRTRVQLEIELPVLCRLLQEGSIAACEFRCLDLDSHRAGCWAVKSSCTACPDGRQTVPGEAGK
ncbi:hypothetical protein [Parahaliea mediterranea]|uniref:Uncharacterized protein n=1 Tax=Parahaliea mediterranea TaxID=651086 RepID=A0A939ILT0_9GAMM|nr:hypothetical protein [Parahaliea mediterranea]MBN7796815.1 hypothetical protein [Parahaliea mediterranea]